MDRVAATDSLSDYLLNHGVSGSGASANATIPEPATVVLLMFAASGWNLLRRWVA